MTAVAEMPTGFADKVVSAQSTFRSVMDAMARPGSIQRTEATVGRPGPMMRGTAALALTLFDNDTPVWLDAQMSATFDVARWIGFHCGAPIVAESSACAFAVIGDPAGLPDFSRFSLGNDQYPDRSTTLILQVESLTQGPSIEMRGPGIEDAALLRAITGVPDFLDRLTVNRALFPRGVDLVLVADDALVAIPRTTRLAVTGGG